MGEESFAEKAVEGNRASEQSLQREKDFNYKKPDRPGENGRPEEGSDEWHGLSGTIPEVKKPKTAQEAASMGGQDKSEDPEQAQKQADQSQQEAQQKTAEQQVREAQQRTATQQQQQAQQR
jgi:hypothetical protein